MNSTSAELNALTSTEAQGEIPARPEDPYIGALGSGRATAPLVGGCLWLLRETLATPWEVDMDGCILFFEDVHAPPWQVDGMLTQLRNAGKLEQVVGVAIGEMYESDPTKDQNPWLRSRSMEDVFEHHLEPLGVPVSLSSKILPEYREYERTSTTVINAYLAPMMSRYLLRLNEQVQSAAAANPPPEAMAAR